MSDVCGKLVTAAGGKAETCTKPKGHDVCWSDSWTPGEDAPKFIPMLDGSVWPTHWKCARCSEMIPDGEVDLRYVDPTSGNIYCSAACKGAGPACMCRWVNGRFETNGCTARNHTIKYPGSGPVRCKRCGREGPTATADYKPSELCPECAVADKPLTESEREELVRLRQAVGPTKLPKREPAPWNNPRRFWCDECASARGVDRAVEKSRIVAFEFIIAHFNERAATATGPFLRDAYFLAMREVRDLFDKETKKT